QPSLEELSAVFRQVREKVAPSVVAITSTRTLRRPLREPGPDRDFFRRFFPDSGGNNNPGGNNNNDEDSPATPSQGDSIQRIGLGSGVIVDVQGRTGYIVTNNHVVAGATSLDVTLGDGQTIENAKVVGTDPATDLAVVKIEADNLKAAGWGSSSSMQPGDFILAFGTPFGYVGSMTHGIVSAVQRQVGLLGPYGYENFIQIDAAINPGNSGGPVANLRGEIIGINTAIASESGGSQGIGFAIPSDEAKRIYQTLREKGQVVRGWLGLQIADVSGSRKEAQASGYKEATGVVVKGVLRDSPAANQIEPSDIITQVNGKKVAKASELRDMIAAAAPGSEVKLQVFRNGKLQDVTVRAGEQPGRPVMASAGGEPKPEADVAQSLGMRLTDLTRDRAREVGVEGKTGALVTAVQRGSVAADAGIGPGDVITRINDQPVQNANDARQALSKINLEQGARFYITNREGSQVAFVQRSRQ
ncbi:MAG TPA: trypsin-like peptidase domain-containing protein, partial [Tepidisphaeraceae bacterium]|nr:trypsin-like peptidase domain-containing protein [Tepidisphaeraceae bacterium]